MAQEPKKKFVISRVYIERHVKFYSHDAQTILRGFGRLAGAMYRLGIALRAYLPAKQVTFLSDSVYEELVEPLKRDITDDLATTKALCQQHNIKPLDNYSYPIERNLRIYYPRAVDIIDIAQSLDTLVCRLNDLWFNGQIDDEKYFELKEKYRTALISVSRRIKKLATIKMEEAKARVDAKEQGEGGKKSGQDDNPPEQDSDATVAPLI